MSAKTKIEWATKTWNPLRGCSKVSEGCRNCYAIRVANRFGGPGKPFEGLTTKGVSGLNWTGKVQLVPEALDEPFRWRNPERVFVNSMSDLFHQDVPFEFIRAVWGRMAGSPRHTFMILTKRPAQAVEFFEWMREQEWRVEESLPNVWLGTRVENQKAADERIPLLLQTPAAVRFLSDEPLLGPVNLNKISRRSVDDDWTYFDDALTGFRATKVGGSYGPRIDWVIVGGESGPRARPMHPDWARSLRDQCQDAGVPFFFKQWGEWAPVHELRCNEPEIKGRPWFNFDPDTALCRIGKQETGRMLDGRTWDEFPEEKNE